MSQVAGKSRAALSVKKHKVKGILKKMRTHMQAFTQGMKVSEEIRIAFDALDETLVLMMDLYDNIERYEEKKELARYIANVFSASNIESNIKDQELKGVLTNMKFYIQANSFLEEYNKAIHAFKQWTFPFASRYFEKAPVNKGNITTLTSISQLVLIYKSQVEDLRDELAKYQATTDSRDNSLILKAFTSDVKSSKPFYGWTNKDWGVSIKKLLAGQQIRLKADISMAGQKSASFFKGKSAIKFKVIELVIKTHNASQQADLNDKLDHFEIKMTHSGISMYSVLGQKYVMYDSNQTYCYSFERTKNNKYVATNRLKHKVEGEEADFLMSPYTWWSFQLIAPQTGDAGFSDLRAFEEQVDLELEGEGLYLDEAEAETSLKGLRVSEFYEISSSENEGFGEISGDEEIQCQISE